MGVLLLIRHGRSTANVDGILAGRAPGVMLDDHGIATATALGTRLAPAGVRAVVSSPLERTRDTAALVFPGVEAAFDLTLPQSDITPENFHSIETITRLVAQRLHAQAA